MGFSFKTVDVQVTEVEDRDPNLYVKRAEDSLRRNQYHEALREMDKAIEYAPSNKKVKYSFEKIKVYEAIGPRADSKEFIKPYLKRFYTDLPLIDFYRVLRVLKNSADAASMLEKHGIPPVLLQLCHNGRATKEFFKEKAREYVRKGQFADAFGCTRVVKENFGEDSDLCFLNGQISQAKGAYTEAVSHYSAAAHYSHPSFQVYTELIDLLVWLNRGSEAQGWIEKGLAVFPFHPNLLHKKADLLYKDKQYEECLAVLETMIGKNTQDAKVFYTIGLIYDHQKKYSLAKRYYKQATAIDGNFKAPENQEREGFLKRKKRLWLSGSALVVLLFVGQVVLFSLGVFKPLVFDDYILTDDVLFVGDTMEVNDDYSYFPVYAKRPDIHYRITGPEIAKINAAGVITGLKEGKTSVQLLNGKKVLDTSEFEVVKPGVSSIRLQLSEANLVVGQKKIVTVDVEMNFEAAEEPDISYTSSDPDVISVDQDGKIEALKVGVAEIKATAGGKSDSLSVHSYAKVDEIILDNPEGFRLQIGKTLTLQPTVKTTPENGEIYPLRFASSDTAIATVSSSGEVTGIGEGQAEIRISSLNGVEKKVPILVTKEAVLEQATNLQAEYDADTQKILLTWVYPEVPSGEDVQFQVSAAVNDGSYQSLSTVSSKELYVSNPIGGANYRFKVEAVSGEATGKPAIVSIKIPAKEQGTGDQSMGTSSANSRTGTSGTGTVTENSADDRQDDQNVENMIRIMSGLVGYWKNVSPDDSFSYDLKYAVVGNNSSDSRENSFKVSYLNKSYYFSLHSSFWEYGMRDHSIRIEGNTLFDIDGDALIYQDPNEFTLQLTRPYHGRNNQTFTFIRTTRAEIPSAYLSNSSAPLP